MTEAIASSSNGLGYTSRQAPNAEAGGSSGSLRKPNNNEELEIRIEFGGGLHLLFSQQPRHTLHIPRYPLPDQPEQAATMKDLIRYMKKTILSEREEMFGEGEGVRPGILVLINDADWELEGEIEYELKDRDEVVFISTLHGVILLPNTNPIDWAVYDMYDRGTTQKP